MTGEPPGGAPRVAVVPRPIDTIVDAVRAGGGVPALIEDADALVWTEARDPEGLREALARSSARWVQLPFAGIERFVEAGVLDPAREWTCAKGIYGPATAEHALALMLAAARRVHEHVRARRWLRRENEPERRLAGATVLIVGTGGIGGALAEMVAPLGARVVAVNRSGRPMPGAQRSEPWTELPNLVGEADFVVLAAPLTAETRGLFGRDLLARMRPDAWLVNVARGGLVDTDALVEALAAGRPGGAALDVTDPEPLPDGHPLWALDDVIVTPHVANTWAMALPDLAALVRRNVERFARGEELEGRVDPALGY